MANSSFFRHERHYRFGDEYNTDKRRRSGDLGYQRRDCEGRSEAAQSASETAKTAAETAKADAEKLAVNAEDSSVRFE